MGRRVGTHGVLKIAWLRSIWFLGEKPIWENKAECLLILFYSIKNIFKINDLKKIDLLPNQFSLKMIFLKIWPMQRNINNLRTIIYVSYTTYINRISLH